MKNQLRPLRIGVRKKLFFLLLLTLLASCSSSASQNKELNQFANKFSDYYCYDVLKFESLGGGDRTLEAGEALINVQNNQEAKDKLGSFDFTTLPEGIKTSLYSIRDHFAKKVESGKSLDQWRADFVKKNEKYLDPNSDFVQFTNKAINDEHSNYYISYYSSRNFENQEIIRDVNQIFKKLKVSTGTDYKQKLPHKCLSEEVFEVDYVLNGNGIGHLHDWDKQEIIDRIDFDANDFNLVSKNMTSPKYVIGNHTIEACLEGIKNTCAYYDADVSDKNVFSMYSQIDDSNASKLNFKNSDLKEGYGDGIDEKDRKWVFYGFSDLLRDGKTYRSFIKYKTAF